MLTTALVEGIPRFSRQRVRPSYISVSLAELTMEAELDM